MAFKICACCQENSGSLPNRWGQYWPLQYVYCFSLVVSAAVVAPAKKLKSAKPKTLATRSIVIDVVKAAIIAANGRKGTSLPTIKEFIVFNYKADVQKLSLHIRRGIFHAM